MMIEVPETDLHSSLRGSRQRGKRTLVYILRLNCILSTSLSPQKMMMTKLDKQSFYINHETNTYTTIIYTNLKQDNMRHDIGFLQQFKVKTSVLYYYFQALALFSLKKIHQSRDA